MDRQTTLRSTIAANVSSPRTNPRSRLRRAGALAGALAFAAVTALGTSTPAFAEEVSWSGQGAHDQIVVCSFPTHSVRVAPYARSMDAFPNGQWVASRIIRRDVTANGAWLYTAWSTTFVKSMNYQPNSSLGGPEFTVDAVWLPGLAFSTYKNHAYSVYVEYYYANASGVWTWHDVHASSYTMVTSDGQYQSVTTCQGSTVS